LASTRAREGQEGHKGDHGGRGQGPRREGLKEFEGEFGSKWPKAVEKITSDQEALLAYYDFPSEHWRHLRTTNPIESPFATVRTRTDLTKEPGSREAGVAMIFKALEAAEGKKGGTRSWPVALRAVRAWLELWVMLCRYWRAFSELPPPEELRVLLRWVFSGRGLYLYAR
jgi:hypothetical protein